MEVLAGVIGAIVGGLATLLIGRVEVRRHERLRASHDLLRRWQSDEMVVARLRAFVVLTENKAKASPDTFLGLTTSLKGTMREEDLLAVNRVLRFFEFFGALAQAEAVHLPTARLFMAYDTEFWLERHLIPLWRYSSDKDDPEELRWLDRLEALKVVLRPPSVRWAPAK